MKDQKTINEWKGLKGKMAAWFFASPLRRLTEFLLFGNIRPRFLGALGLQGNEVVVDAGCGSGSFSLLVASHLPRGRLICVDISEEMLTRLRRRVARKGLADRVEVCKGDVTALDLPDAFADLAFSNAVWHEVPEPSNAAGELFRVLKPGGRIVVTDWRDTSIGRRVGSAYRHGDRGPFGVDDLVQIMRDAGFTDVAGETLRHTVIAWGAKCCQATSP